MSFEQGYAGYLRSRRKRRADRDTTVSLDRKLAEFLATLTARPDATVSVVTFVELFRARLRGVKQRQSATRTAIMEALGRLNILIGKTPDRRQCIIGYSPDAAPTLAVDEQGKIIREVA